ncbi:MAG: proton-conducting transporter membrane subunit, partial [Planctomycetota bacterium]
MSPDRLVPTLLLIAWLAPLASFAVTAVAGAVLAQRDRGVDAASARTIARVATGAVLASLIASLVALGVWVGEHGAAPAKHGAEYDTAEPRAVAEAGAPVAFHDAIDHPAVVPHAHDPAAYTGEWFRFLEVGPLEASAGYYLDGLAVLMAVVVTLVASCVHVYAMGYLAEETAAEGDDAVTDREVTTYYGEPFRRAGRLHRFYQHLSLFTFAMLGIVVAGNALQTFVFWELVGATSYLLIGFYYERPKAAAAANKAMLVNRVGDVGMLVGLMALWSLAGTLEYRELFARAGEWLATPGDAYSLLAVAAGGMVLGCVGKSAQAPLWSWLPDAMAGPTPVSALVHSATMVAAGVFLIARLTPLMPVEVLQAVAVIGAVTLLLGAVLATAATDLKRVLAFSTISQLGFMTLSLGLGGWT